MTRCPLYGDFVACPLPTPVPDRVFFPRSQLGLFPHSRCAPRVGLRFARMSVAGVRRRHRACLARRSARPWRRGDPARLRTCMGRLERRPAAKGGRFGPVRLGGLVVVARASPGSPSLWPSARAACKQLVSAVSPCTRSHAHAWPALVSAWLVPRPKLVLRLLSAHSQRLAQKALRVLRPAHAPAQAG